MHISSRNCTVPPVIVQSLGITKPLGARSLVPIGVMAVHCPPGTLICGGACLEILTPSGCPADDPAGRAVIAALPNCNSPNLTIGGLCEGDGECGTRQDMDVCVTNEWDAVLGQWYKADWDIYKKVAPADAVCADAPADRTGIRLAGSTIVDALCVDIQTDPPCELLTSYCAYHPQVQAFCPRTCGRCATCLQLSDQCYNSVFGSTVRERCPLTCSRCAGSPEPSPPPPPMPSPPEPSPPPPIPPPPAPSSPPHDPGYLAPPTAPPAPPHPPCSPRPHPPPSPPPSPPHPPPDPPPPPPSLPAEVPAVKFTATVDGTLETFNQNAYRANLAAMLGDGMRQSDITLQLTAGSVTVVATISPPTLNSAKSTLSTLTALTAASNATAILSTGLGMTVASVAPPVLTFALKVSPEAPPPPPPTPSPPEPSPPPPVPPVPFLPGELSGLTDDAAASSGVNTVLLSVVLTLGLLITMGVLHRWVSRARGRGAAGGGGARARIGALGGVGAGENLHLGGARNLPSTSAGVAMSVDMEFNYDLFKSLGAMQSLTAGGTHGGELVNGGGGLEPLDARKIGAGAESQRSQPRGLLSSLSRAGASICRASRPQAATPSSLSCKRRGRAPEEAESTTQASIEMSAVRRQLSGGAMRGRAIGGGASVASAVLPWGEIKLSEALGDGAFGTVYAAEYAYTRCALKRLHPPAPGNEHTMAQLVSALKAEFDVMLQLRHPHVLQMIGFASDGVSNCGLLMELMEANLNDVLYAPTFAQYNSWEGSLLVLATDVARGMAYLHKQSVLHCDLKPANILISAQWVGKVADFGQSWQLEATAATATAAAAEPSGGGGADSRGLHGTPPYMAPEVVISRRYAPPVDVWSFGCVLAHMATRRPPYSGQGLRSVDQVLDMIRSGHVAPTAHIEARPREGDASAESVAAIAAAASMLTARQLVEGGSNDSGGTAGAAEEREEVARHMPRAIHDLALACTQRDASKRPSFDAIADLLTSDRMIGAVLGTTTSTPRTTAEIQDGMRPVGRLRRGSAVQHGGSASWARARGAVRLAGHTRASADSVAKAASGGGTSPSPAGTSNSGGALNAARRGAGGECVTSGPLSSSMGGDVMLTGGFREYFRSLGAGSSYGGRTPRVHEDSTRPRRGNRTRAPSAANIVAVDAPSSSPATDSSGGRREPNYQRNAEEGGWFGMSLMHTFQQSIRGMLDSTTGEAMLEPTAGDVSLDTHGQREGAAAGVSATSLRASAMTNLTPPAVTLDLARQRSASSLRRSDHEEPALASYDTPVTYV